MRRSVWRQTVEAGYRNAKPKAKTQRKKKEKQKDEVNLGTSIMLSPPLPAAREELRSISFFASRGPTTKEAATHFGKVVFYVVCS